MTHVDVSPGGRKIFGQGAVLFGGFLTSQIASFGRNALLGHLLSKGDFGVAATIAITLQLLEIISDVAVDRMILQAKDGDEPRLVNTAHVILILRGAIIAAFIWLTAPLIASFFSVPGAAWAFQWLALVPLIKGFMHLDIRRMQRHLTHGPFAVVEAVPQLLALSMVLPLLNIFGGYATVVFLGVAQSLSAVLASHLLAERPYGLAFDRTYLRRFISFGWPILLSALPLIAVYQGDRVIVGHYMGMEVLAAYSAAFMLAMVPGLLTSKVCLSLVMPLLADVRSRGEIFLRHFQIMTEGVVVIACAYLVFFALLGGYALGFAFGENYSDQGPLLTLLALMWGLRIIQAAPGTGLMSLGVTKPLFITGIVRATVLLPILVFTMQGMAVEGIAAFGVLGEFLSLAYVCRAMERERPGAGLYLFKCSMLYLAFASGLLMLGAHACDDEPLRFLLPQFLLGEVLVLLSGLYFFPRLAREARRLIGG